MENGELKINNCGAPEKRGAAVDRGRIELPTHGFSGGERKKYAQILKILLEIVRSRYPRVRQRLDDVLPRIYYLEQPLSRAPNSPDPKF